MVPILIAGLLQVPAAAESTEAKPSGKSRPSVLNDRAAAAKAAKSGEPVEVTSRRGERSTTFALPDGKFEVTEQTKPVRVRLRDGWAQPDATLVRSGGVIAPKASTAELRFSPGGDGPLASMERDGRRMEFTWPAKLPEPRLEGDTAIYPEIVKDVDLRLRADTDGFSHLLEVKTAEAAKNPSLTRLALGLEAPGLSVRVGSGRELSAVDSGGRGVFEAPAPLMWDSSGIAASRDQRSADARRGPAEGSKQAAVKVELDAMAKRMVLVPDQGLLRAADTKFPVFIDPVWKTTTPAGWAMVSSGFPDEPYWKFKGNDTEGVGRCEVDKSSECGRTQTKRVYYRMPIKGIAKTATVLKAVFTAFNTHSFDCDDNRTVQLYRTDKLTSSATWNNRSSQWKEHVASKEFAYCSKRGAEFASSELTDHVESAARSRYKTITFMLKAYSESSMAWWKRFHEDAALSIQYNHRPNLPKQREMSSLHGGPCVGKTEPPWIKAPARMQARLTDPDTEDKAKIQGQFQLSWAAKADGSDWGAKWTSPKTDALTTGSYFKMDMPPTMPKKTLIAWAARAWDSHQWGPWSWEGPAQTACYFYFDDTAPAQPVVTSAMYPEDTNEHGGVGDAGAFTISDPAKAAVRYQVSVNGGTAIKIPTVDGTPKTIHLAPDRSGDNIFTFQSFTRAGVNSLTRDYRFLAGPGRTQRARFSLDEDDGSTSVTGKSAGDVPATMHGEGASLGAEGISGTALKLSRSGTGYAATAAPVITDPSKSFAVSAWARYDGDAGEYAAVVSQDSTDDAGLVLRYSPASKKWEFGRALTGAWATASSTAEAAPGKWTHLTGAYDASTRQYQIYVDGTAGTAATASERRDPTGPFNLGRSKYDDSYGRYFDGLIDDVRVYEHNITAADAARLAAKEDIPAVARAHWNLDEDTGTSQVTGKAAGYQATLAGAAEFGHKGVFDNAVQLGGNGGHLATSVPLVQTDRSFSVGAWVNLADKSSSRYAVSQFGNSEIGFELGYESVADQWAFRMRAKDEKGASWINAFSDKNVLTGTWTFLLGVYDADADPGTGAGQIRLYVNDKPPVAVANTTPWQARGPFVIGANQFGGSKGGYWKGLIDDIRVYDRVLAPDEIAELVQQRPQIAARWKLNTDGADDTPYRRDLALESGATIHPSAGFIPDNAGLLLNGEGAHARTQSRVVDHRHSFTIAGWVRTPAELPGTNTLTVFAQAGAKKDVFSLAYLPDSDSDKTGHWQAQMTNADSDGGVPQTVKHAAVDEDDWAHIAVVYDAMNRVLSLYVDATLDGSASQIGHAWGFDAGNGGIQIGRTLHPAANERTWRGAIDDVWVYQGILAAEQIQMLAQPEEVPTSEGPP